MTNATGQKIIDAAEKVCCGGHGGELIWHDSAADYVEEAASKLFAAGPWTPISTPPEKTGMYFVTIIYDEGQWQSVEFYSTSSGWQQSKSWRIAHWAAINQPGEEKKDAL